MPLWSSWISPGSAVGFAAALNLEVTPVRALAFLGAMGAVGYGMGRLLGDEFHLFPVRPVPRPRAQTDARVAAALSAIESGVPIPDMPELMQSIASANDVAILFADDRIQRLVTALQEPASQADANRRTRLEEVYQLICHVVVHAADDLRVPLAAALGRILPWHRGLVPWLLAACARHPDLWNDLQACFDDAAAKDPSVRRFLDSQAGSDRPFVQRANDMFMSEMARFRRLCEDYNVGLETIPSAELDRMIQRELTVLERSGTASRRFMWLPSNVRVVISRMSDAQVGTLLGGVRQGIAPACALASRAVLVWTANGRRDHAEAAVDALAAAANEHGAAADALFGLLHGIRLHIAIKSASDSNISHAGCRPPRFTRRDFDRSAPRTHRGFPLGGAEPRSDHLTRVRR
jgi:hypothetical protein